MAIIGTFGLNLHKRLGVPPVSVKATTAFTSGKVKQICPAHAPVRPGAGADRRRQPVRQHRRAHQRHRLQGLCAPDPGREIRRSLGRGAPAGRKRCANRGCEHGRGHAGQRGRHGALSQAHGQRARHRARAGDDRLEQMERDRSRPALPAGQGHRQLHQHEGRRGRVQAARAPGAPLWRGRRGHGV